MSSRTLACLLAAVVGLVGCYIEPVEDSGCQDAMFRLTCRQLDDRIAILEASFSSNWTAADGNSSSCGDGSWSWENNGGDGGGAYTGPFDIRPSLNYRCSGMNHCSFILTADHKPATDWGPGIVTLKYACFNKDHMTKFCNEEIAVKDEGFVMSPGYPGYYVHQNDCYWLLGAAPGQRIQLSLLDMSLRAAGAGEAGGNCTDRLQVTEDDHILLTECGELARAAVVLSDASVLNVTLTGLTHTVFPKRGILFHYKAIGCPILVPPVDGYTVYKNETAAQFMCCVDYMFPDTLQRVRNLHCDNGNTWSTSLPDCINSTMWTLGREANPPPTVVPLHSTNINSSHTAAIIKESDFILDVILPTMIICTLIIGNGVILFVIFYLRKRKSPESGDEEELGEIYQPHDGSVSDKAINV